MVQGNRINKVIESFTIQIRVFKIRFYILKHVWLGTGEKSVDVIRR